MNDWNGELRFSYGAGPELDYSVLNDRRGIDCHTPNFLFVGRTNPKLYPKWFSLFLASPARVFSGRTDRLNDALKMLELTMAFAGTATE